MTREEAIKIIEENRPNYRDWQEEFDESETHWPCDLCEHGFYARAFSLVTGGPYYKGEDGETFNYCPKCGRKMTDEEVEE